MVAGDIHTALRAKGLHRSLTVERSFFSMFGKKTRKSHRVAKVTEELEIRSDQSERKVEMNWNSQENI